jgi:hypothetical protein
MATPSHPIEADVQRILAKMNATAWERRKTELGTVIASGLLGLVYVGLCLPLFVQALGRAFAGGAMPYPKAVFVGLVGHVTFSTLMFCQLSAEARDQRTAGVQVAMAVCVLLMTAVIELGRIGVLWVAQ